MYGAWTRGAEANTEFAGMFREAASHEGRCFLMPHADELNFALSLAKRFDDGVNTIANDAKDMRNAPAVEGVHQYLCRGWVACRLTRLADNVRSCCARRCKRVCRRRLLRRSLTQ